MKKLVIAVVFAALIVAGSPLFAQNSREQSVSDFYYIKVSIERIWPHRLGYIVQYRRGLGNARVFLPIEWFSSTANRGEIINLPRGNSWPSMAVYYRDGEFSHVRLYVHRQKTHRTWGVIPQGVNFDTEFSNIETVELQF